jgi:hypothetical protein
VAKKEQINMATDRTNMPVVGVHLASNDMSIPHTPAYLVNNPQGLRNEYTSTPLAGMPVFLNPVEGHNGAATHEGDSGKNA